MMSPIFKRQLYASRHCNRIMCFNGTITLFCFFSYLPFLWFKSQSPPLEVYLGEASIYHSAEVFKLNYAEMERDFKVFMYPDEDPITYYQKPPKLASKYASEEFFFKNIKEGQFLTNDPEKAHLFFIPIPCHKMEGKAENYNMTSIVKNYVEGLINKYPYWNRTLGTDHFFVACHDFGVKATEGVPLLVKNSIRVVCSPRYDSGYIPHKDVALPQLLHPFTLPPAVKYDLSDRSSLAFWAGYRNSKEREDLATAWKNDRELDIQSTHIDTTNGSALVSLILKVKTSTFCICPAGAHANTVGIPDSIHYGCVPVILSDHYDLPFNDILDWHKFAVILKEADVFQMKHILKAIPNSKFRVLHHNTIRARTHFQWNSPPIKYDAFHMVMYELWLRRHLIKY